jgi:hypothetical protein
MARRTALIKAAAREWTPFEQVEITDKMREAYPLLKGCTYLYKNSRYEVQIFSIETPIGGVNQATIIRHGDVATISWEEIQRIIHELFGDDVTAVEIFPALKHEWKTKIGLRVLWVLPEGYELPFGLHVKGAFGRSDG